MINSLLPTEFHEDDVFKCATCTSTLYDPVLLKCLHSVCRSCVSDATISVTCPVCRVTTDTSTAKTNNLVSSLEHHSLILQNVFSCEHCIDNATAVAWCYACQKPLCADLQNCHQILLPAHNVISLNECTLLSELYRPPLRYCTKHDEELKLVCFTCQDCCCYKCVLDVCYASSHDVQPLQGLDVIKRISDRLADLSQLQSDLNLTAVVLQSYFKLPETVANARKESLNVLQNAKKTVMESLDRAYLKAESSLLTCWDTLLSKSLGLRESIERLQARLDWTNKYCQLVQSSNDIAGVFPQLEAITASLCSLLAEVRHVKEPSDPLKMVSLNVGLPCDLDLITDDWLGLAQVVSEDFSSSVCVLPAGNSSSYHTRKVSTVKELEEHLHYLKEERELHQCVQQSLEQLQSQMKSKDHQLIATQDELKKLLHQHKQQLKQLERERKTAKVAQSKLKSKTQQLVATRREVKKLLDRHKEQQKQLERERKTAKQMQSKLKSKMLQLVAADNEKKTLSVRQKDQEQLEQEHIRIEQLQSELRSKTQQLENEGKKLLDLQKEQQEQLALERRRVEQLRSELKSKTQQLAAPTKPLSFDSKPCFTFKGPGSCWDVAVTPQGRLLVAAMAEGLKEYDATSFHELATWRPDAALLGHYKGFYVRTVDVLLDGRALVGLSPSKLVVLLRRDVDSSSVGSSIAAEVWQVERCVAELQGAPRHLSAWGDRLLAVLEDRDDKKKKLWQPGPGLVLFSLSDGDKQLHRQQLDYNAGSVALTDRGVIVASDEQVELTYAAGTVGGNGKCYVVDCYNHFGVRLWRHEIGGGLKVMSVCSDSVGRVMYAAKCRGSVIALSVDDGRELSEAVALSTTSTETSYAIALDKAPMCRLVLIRIVDKKPNSINIFSVG